MAIYIAIPPHHSRVLTSLNISNNYLGELVLPEGWTEEEAEGEDGDYIEVYKHVDGREQEEHPGGLSEGVIAIAAAIPSMGTLENLHIGNNGIPTRNMNDMLHSKFQ